MLNWPSILTGFGTIAMAVAVALTVIFAYRTWRKSLKVDKEERGSELFKEFINSNGYSFFKKLSNKIYPEGSIKIFKKKSFGDTQSLLLFLAKIGRLLKYNIITMREIELYFYNYFFSINVIENLITNLSLIHSRLDKHVYENLDYFINELEDYYNFYGLKNLVQKRFKRKLYATKAGETVHGPKQGKY